MWGYVVLVKECEKIYMFIKDWNDVFVEYILEEKYVF